MERALEEKRERKLKRKREIGTDRLKTQRKRSEKRDEVEIQRSRKGSMKCAPDQKTAD